MGVNGNNQQKCTQITEALADYISTRVPHVKTLLASGSVNEDFARMVKAKTFIGSCSRMSWTVAMMRNKPSTLPDCVDLFACDGCGNSAVTCDHASQSMLMPPAQQLP